MSTPTINRPVKRTARRNFMHYRRPIVIILEPGDTIAMRLKGTRTTYRADLESVFKTLAVWHGAAARLKKIQERQAKRGTQAKRRGK